MAESEATLTEIPASEILGKIQKGEAVEYDHVRVIGDLDVNKLDLPTKPVKLTEEMKNPFFDISEESKIVSASIRITNSTVNGKVNFCNISFEDSINFERTIFNGDAQWKSQSLDGNIGWEINGCILSHAAQFLSNANFWGCKFSSDVDFWGAKFNDTADFREAQFSGIFSSFHAAKFGGNAFFSRAEFSGDAIFWGAEFSRIGASFDEVKFRDNANFMSVQFRGSSIFNKTQFDGEASFWKAKFFFAIFGDVQFNGNANFWETQFDNASFSEAQFNRNADFKEAQFNRNASFKGVQFNHNANFRGVQFDDNADFGLAQFNRVASFEKFNKKVTQFNKFLILDNCKIYSMFIDAEFTQRSERPISLKFPDLNHLFAHWGSIKDHIQYDGSTYLALVRNYNNLEWFEDADQCYYEYRELNRKNKSWYDEGKGFNWSKFLDCVAFASCGYGVRFGFVFGWMVGLIFFFGIINLLSGNSAPESALMSTMAFTASLPNNVSPISNNLRYAFVVERFLGTVLIALFVVVLTKKLIR